MEVFFPIILIIFIIFLVIFDARNAYRAFDSRMNRAEGLATSKKNQVLIYVFARCPQPQKPAIDLPKIYFIPCDNRKIAEKLAVALRQFCADKGNIVDLPDVSSLRKHISNHYGLTDFDLSRFPIPTDKLLGS